MEVSLDTWAKRIFHDLKLVCLSHSTRVLKVCLFVTVDPSGYFFFFINYCFTLFMKPTFTSIVCQFSRFCFLPVCPSVFCSLVVPRPIPPSPFPLNFASTLLTEVSNRNRDSNLSLKPPCTPRKTHARDKAF